MTFDTKKYIEIFSLYPSFISHQFRLIFTEDRKSQAIDRILECFETIINHLTFFAICQLIDICKEKSINVNTNLKEKVFSRLIHKFSLGSKVEILRDLLILFEKNNCLDIFSALIKLNPNLNEFMQICYSIVTFRNDIEHNKIQITDENEEIYFNKYFDLLEKLIFKCDFFKNVRLIYPIEKYESEIKYLEFTGIAKKPIIRRIKDSSVIKELNLCYIIDSENEIALYAHPFWQYIMIESEYHLVFGQFDDDKKVILSENFSGISIVDKSFHLNNFLEAIHPIYPDYIYQNNPYLKGHNFLMLNYKKYIKLISVDGDIETIEDRYIKKIRFNDKVNHDEIDELKEDHINIGYHDAPLFPISDEEFNLKVFSQNNSNLNIKYDIKNDGFRSFKIGLGRKLMFEEEEKIRLSCFEPMLINGLLIDGKDYYESSVKIPTNLYEFTFELTPEYEFDKFDVFYLSSEVPFKNVVNKKIYKNSNGISTLYFSIKEPEVGKFFIIRYSVKEHNLKNNFYPKNDNFRTGLSVYNWLKKNIGLEYAIEESEDKIIIKYKKNL